MVDYNNETTVTRPAADVARIQILERRANVIEAFEFYQKKDANGIHMDLGVIQSRLYGLFLELQAALKRRETTGYGKVLNQVKGRKYDDLLEAFLFINEYLDKINLTKIDTNRTYDSTLVAEEDREKGL